MKKFKGGLYADLGNYKTNLPNTEILNNFFASNPVGYRSGGMVKGISGGNPTGMKVTGGFLNRAQNMQSGGAVSSYYSPSNVGVRPGDFRAAGREYRSDLFDKIFELRQSNPRDFGFASDDPKGHEAIAKALGVSVLDVKRSLAENTPNSGIRIAPMDRVEQYDKEGKVKGAPVLSTLEQSEKQYPEGTKLPTYNESVTEEDDKKISEEPKTQYTGGEGSSRMGDDGITGIPLEKFKEIKEKTKEQREIAELNRITGLDDDSTEESIIEGSAPETITSSKDTKTDSKKENGSAIDGVSSTYQTMKDEGLLDEPRSAKEISEELFSNNSDFQKIIAGYEEASKEDKAALKKIGEEYYGKDKGDAPAWAMPLMMAGLQMAASNNPDMLGALGEGGIKGLEQYAKQEKEKREDAKDKIALDMQKATKLVEISSRNLDFKKDIAVINSNIQTKALDIASQEKINFNNNLRATIIADADRELSEQEFNKEMQLGWAKYDMELKNTNTQLQIAWNKLLLDEKKVLSDVDYQKKKLAQENVKIIHDKTYHDNLVDLQKVDKGKTTTVMMPDADGDVKAHKVQVYYNYETESFETKVLGFAPPDADYLEDITSQIRESILQDPAFEDATFQQIEDAIADQVQKNLNDKYGDIDAALEN